MKKKKRNNTSLLIVAGAIVAAASLFVFRKPKRLVCGNGGPWFGTYDSRTVQTCTDPIELSGRTVVVITDRNGVKNVVVPVSQMPALGYIQPIPGIWVDKVAFIPIQAAYDARAIELRAQSLDVWLAAAQEGGQLAIQIYGEVPGADVAVDMSGATPGQRLTAALSTDPTMMIFSRPVVQQSQINRPTLSTI